MNRETKMYYCSGCRERGTMKERGRFIFVEPAFALSAFSVPFLSPAVGGRTSNIVVRGKSFACGERRIISKKKSRLGDAPVQVTTLSIFGKLLVIFYTLFGVNRGSRAANHDLCKNQAAERRFLPKGVKGSQGQCPTVPCGTEGKPDFPLKVRPNSFFVCFPVTLFSKKEFAFGRINKSRLAGQSLSCTA